MVTDRNHSIDVAKGALILLVIAGHVMAGTLEDKPLRFIIYSFHMQFFLFISGYLVNIDKLATFTPRQLFAHYFNRMLGLWILAWVVYTAYVVHDEEITLRLIVHNAAYPFYHLWYVPTLFTLICVSYVVRRVSSSRKLALGILTGFAVIFFIISLWVKIPSLLGLASLIWFVMGMCCRNVSGDMLTEVKGGVYGSYTLQ